MHLHILPIKAIAFPSFIYCKIADSSSYTQMYHLRYILMSSLFVLSRFLLKRKNLYDALCSFQGAAFKTLLLELEL